MRVSNALVLVVVLIVVAPVVFRLTVSANAQPGYRNFGTIPTRFGTAAVVCGGDTAPRCGVSTGLVFAQCTPAVRAYFGNFDAHGQDERARVLLRKRPPSGSQWFFLCGNASQMRGGPARLKSE